VPHTVGLTVHAAQVRLRRLKLVPKLTGTKGRVVAQTPRPGVAAAPGMKVTLVVRPS
jgi:beta-lactam-binding protein with PASTA domain